MYSDILCKAHLTYMYHVSIGLEINAIIFNTCLFHKKAEWNLKKLFVDIPELKELYSKLKRDIVTLIN